MFRTLIGPCLILIHLLSTVNSTKKECLDEKKGMKYEGSQSVAENGLECRGWSTIRNYRFLGYNHNHCRNIFNDKQPWCFTKKSSTDRSRSWAYCSIPLCSTDSAGGKKNQIKLEWKLELPGVVHVRLGSESGVVCGHRFTQNDAKVVCRMMGYSAQYAKALQNVDYASIDDNTQVALKKLRCSGDEQNIKECQNFRWSPGNRRCRYNRAAVVQCQAELELVAVATHYRSDSKGVICADQFTDNDAKIVCRSLYFPWRNAKSISDTNRNEIKPDEKSKIILKNLQCSGSEYDIDYCSNYQWRPNTECPSMRAAMVKCSDQPDTRPQPTTPIPDATTVAGESQCGARLVTTNDISSRIVGGYVTEYGAFPWMAGVRQLEDVKEPNKHFHHCGATIVNEFTVVSAAHCLSKDKAFYRIRTGDWDNKNQEEFEQQFEIEKFTINENYNTETFTNDIAIIKLKPSNGRGIQFNNYVQPVCLPAGGEEPENRANCYASGWGLMEQAAMPSRLMAARIPLIEQERCDSLYPNKFVKTSMLCAGYSEGKIDTCGLDSGGPLVCSVKNKFTLMGIVSWGPVQCGKKNSPGVYSKVSQFIDWINKHV